MQQEYAVAGATEAPTVESGPALDFTAPIAADTQLRCLFALVIVRIGMRIIAYGARTLSPTHPARHAYRTAVFQWRDRTREMPWRGFVPTDRRVASWTQALWLCVILFTLDAIVYMFGLPHVPTHGLLRHHLPHLIVRFSS